MDRTIDAVGSAGQALRWTEFLAGDVGPRRPTSRAERTAAEWLRAQLAWAGLDARLESFPAYATFAHPQAGPPLIALAGDAARGAGWRRVGTALCGAALALALAEDDVRLRPLSRLLARRRSQNLVASIPPRGVAKRTLCLVSHLDSSRSGVIFDPRVAARLRSLLAITGGALAAEAVAPVLERGRSGRLAVRAARAWLVLALMLLAERELRGSDVPGANDNASGAAVTASIAAAIAAGPLESTRLVLLVTGAEEAGTLGAEAFLRARETGEWLFLNFDGVAAPATLRYLPREGLVRTFAADERLLGVAGDLAGRRPDLGLEPARHLVGLTYDATPILALGGRALTISAQDDAIPNYHQPSDDTCGVAPDVLARALEVGRELVAAVDRGEAD